jgi:hypothetical protein
VVSIAVGLEWWSACALGGACAWLGALCSGLNLIDWPDLTSNFTAMVENTDGANFQCYFSKSQSFGGIFLKMGSFNGMDLSFPK